MKILLYNIFDGCPQKSRFNKLVSFIRKESADVIVLLEANDWDSDYFVKLNEFKRRTRYLFHSFLKTATGFNIAVFSKEQISFEERFLSPFHHGLLKTKIRGLTLLSTHLTPHDSSFRLTEVESLLSNVNPDEKTIILGDLNSLSPHDGYDEVSLLNFMKQKRIIKFGSTKIEYTSIDLLEKNDFFDAYLLKHKTFRHSVPTPANDDDGHFARLRLDYFFVNSPLKPFIDKIQIIQNSKTNMISDHYPIILYLDDALFSSKGLSDL